MWEQVDTLLERAPEGASLHLHRVELLEARRRRNAGEPVGDALLAEEREAGMRELAMLPLLARVRELVDGPLVLMKGAEIACDYPGPRLRRYSDLDLLTGDPEAAQTALLAAGFTEVFPPEWFVDIHHLRPLWWPGLPLTIELHTEPHWPAGAPAPDPAELLATAVPGRVGIDGVQALHPAAHAIALAAHDWAHAPLGRLGSLIDVAAALQRSSDEEATALARRWGCGRLWRTTRRAAGALLENDRRSAATALWARHLAPMRERTVLEWHLHRALAPAWGLPGPRGARGALASLGATSRPLPGEPASVKLRRSALALRQAGLPRSAHELALEERDARGLLADRRVAPGGAGEAL